MSKDFKNPNEISGVKRTEREVYKPPVPIDSISVERKDGCVVCYIDELSDELKELIRGEISHVCYGRQQVDEDGLCHYSYKKTLADFLNRYRPKPENTRKGMIGEFVAHLIINKVLENLKTISVFFNKEDQGIKKGFDLNYVDADGTAIWYGEVKSGEVPKGSRPDSKNRELLGEAKSSLGGLLSGERPNIWDSVIIDAKLSFAADESKRVGDLLKMDISQIQKDSATKKNAILISVLFHNVKNRINPGQVKQHLDEVIAESIFSRVIIFSIQKSTYQKIEEFLSAELSK